MPFTRFHQVTPVLPVRSVSEAVEYFVERLGFGGTVRDETAASSFAGVELASLKFAIVDRGEVQLFLKLHDEQDLPPRGAIVLRFVVDDADDLYDEYENRDVFDLDTELRDTSWGTREFEFHEPNGAKLVFLMTVPG